MGHSSKRVMISKDTTDPLVISNMNHVSLLSSSRMRKATQHIISSFLRRQPLIGTGRGYPAEVGRTGGVEQTESNTRLSHISL